MPVAKWFCGINSAPLFVGVFGDTILPNTQRLFFKNLPLKGVWGGVAMLMTGDRNARFPGVTAFAFAACLTFFVKFSIILLNEV
jgi:hypothetical protein